MNSRTSELENTLPDERMDPVHRHPTGEPRGDDVHPVSSDATGVRENGGARGREDATRPRRRYITH